MLLNFNSAAFLSLRVFKIHSSRVFDVYRDLKTFRCHSGLNKSEAQEKRSAS